MKLKINCSITYQELRNNKRVERLRKQMKKELDPKKYSQEQREERKEYYQENKEKIKKQKKEYLQENPEYNNEYYKQRRKIDINFRTLCCLRSRLGRAFREYSKTGKIFSSKKYGIDYKKIMKHLEPFPEDISLYHIDHIRPLCSFDLTDPEQVKIAFAPENHQWLTIEENLRKGSRMIYVKIKQ